jgi:hypothetical protein
VTISSSNSKKNPLDDNSSFSFSSSAAKTDLLLEEENNTNPNVRETIVLPFNGQMNIEKIRENIATNQTDYVLGDGFLNIGDNLSWSNPAAKLVLYP